jgi:hypothetical protein
MIQFLSGSADCACIQSLDSVPLYGVYFNADSSRNSLNKSLKFLGCHRVRVLCVYLCVCVSVCVFVCVAAKFMAKPLEC